MHKLLIIVYYQWKTQVENQENINKSNATGVSCFDVGNTDVRSWQGGLGTKKGTG